MTPGPVSPRPDLRSATMGIPYPSGVPFFSRIDRRQADDDFRERRKASGVREIRLILRTIERKFRKSGGRHRVHNSKGSVDRRGSPGRFGLGCTVGQAAVRDPFLLVAQRSECLRQQSAIRPRDQRIENVGSQFGSAGNFAPRVANDLGLCVSGRNRLLVVTRCQEWPIMLGISGVAAS